jgi:hypothetical protein
MIAIMPTSASVRALALVFVTAAALAGCEVSKRSEVCVAANQGKSVPVIGYITVGGFTLVSSDGEFPLKLAESMGAEEHIRAYVKLGEGPNTMKPLPQGDFTNEDIEVRLADGSTKGWGDRIKVTGTLAVDGDTCTLRGPVTIEAP